MAPTEIDAQITTVAAAQQAMANDDAEDDGEWNNVVSAKKGRKKTGKSNEGSNIKAAGAAALNGKVGTSGVDRWAALRAEQTTTPKGGYAAGDNSGRRPSAGVQLPPEMGTPPPSSKIVERNSSIKERPSGGASPATVDRWAALAPSKSDKPEEGNASGRKNNRASPKLKAAAPPMQKPVDELNLSSPDDQDASNPRRARDDVHDEIRRVLELEKCMLRRSDFDTKTTQFLHAIHQKGGRSKVREAFELVFSMTTSKSRDSIQNWPGYVSKLVKSFFDDLSAEVKAERKASLKEAAGARAPSAILSTEPPSLLLAPIGSSLRPASLVKC
jgi:hypothetical protein